MHATGPFLIALLFTTRQNQLRCVFFVVIAFRFQWPVGCKFAKVTRFIIHEEKNHLCHLLKIAIDKDLARTNEYLPEELEANKKLQ